MIIRISDLPHFLISDLLLTFKPFMSFMVSCCKRVGIKRESGDVGNSKLTKLSPIPPCDYIIRFAEVRPHSTTWNSANVPISI